MVASPSPPPPRSRWTRGRVVPVRLSLEEGPTLVTRVDTAGLSYPIVVDPSWIAGPGFPEEALIACWQGGPRGLCLVGTSLSMGAVGVYPLAFGKWIRGRHFVFGCVGGMLALGLVSLFVSDLLVIGVLAAAGFGLGSYWSLLFWRALLKPPGTTLFRPTGAPGQKPQDNYIRRA